MLADCIITMQKTLMSVRRLTTFCRAIRQTRCIQTATWRLADEGVDDGGSEVAQTDKPRKRSVAASDLLNVLSDLRVQRSNGEGPETSLARRKRVSAAANFQRMISKAEKRKGKERVEEGEESAGVTDELKAPSLDELHEMTVEAAREVAQVYPDKELVESELLKELKRHDEASAAGESGDLDSISSVLTGIRVQRQSRIEKQRDSQDENRERSMPDFGSSFASLDFNGQDDREARRKEKNEPYQRQRKRTLFDRQRLNIFTALPEADSMHTGEMPSAEEGSLWQQELEKQLRALSYSMVRNGFEEAMKLTEEGKLWRYPIDNEQGLEEEQAVGFHEHVFLDHLLADFPQRDQVLDFMELVLIGLSKNPFLTVAQKQDHVAWFRDYFWQKEEVFERLAEEEKQGKAASR